jgi:hypothetical protein
MEVEMEDREVKRRRVLTLPKKKPVESVTTYYSEPESKLERNGRLVAGLNAGNEYCVMRISQGKGKMSFSAVHSDVEKARSEARRLNKEKIAGTYVILKIVEFIKDE